MFKFTGDVCTLTSSVNGERWVKKSSRKATSQVQSLGVLVGGLSNFTRSFPGEQNSWCFASTE